VRYVGTASFVDDFAERVATADLPDVAIFPQPEPIPGLAAGGDLKPLDVDSSNQVRDTIGDSWQLAQDEDARFLAVPYRIVVKSLVWFRSDVFGEEGYEVPATLEELESLSADMISDGYTPWCAGMDDYSATGWWGTDWVEDLVLRQAGPTAYEQWGSLETPFSDESIVRAMETFDRMLSTRGAVAGGRRSILSTPVRSAMDPMFDTDGGDPGCLMFKQASFQAGFLPSGVSFGDGRLDVFPLPPVKAEPAPLLLSGELAGALSDAPAATQFLLHLLSDEAADPWRALGGTLVLRADEHQLEKLPPLDRFLVRLIEQAPAVEFDASDLMPRSIGSGAFWQGMIDLVAGDSAAAVAARVDQAVAELESQ